MGENKESRPQFAHIQRVVCFLEERKKTMTTGSIFNMFLVCVAETNKNFRNFISFAKMDSTVFTHTLITASEVGQMW